MRNQRLVRRCITGIVLALATILLYLSPPILMTMILVYALGHILVYEWPSMAAPWGTNRYLLTIIYPITPLLMMIQLNESPVYRGYLFAIIALVALFDTASFIAGTLWGRHHIVPAISPGKTWEGAFGGCVATTVILIHFSGSLVGWHWITGMIHGIVLSSTALLGDLIESWFKRTAQQKDSGSLLPGHGGILDRIDGIIAVVALFYVLKSFIVTGY